MTPETGSAAVRPRNYSRRRAALLASVYFLAGLHIAHWKVAGRTLAPLELNELMYTLELGIVTAGFLFMAVAALGTVVFGRFFCSWGCHIIALQDLCHWLLGKIGINPKPVRSRVLLLVPLYALFDMFVLPQALRVAEGRPYPSWRLAGEDEGWASFVTSDFWRNLPGPGVTITTFLICGFVIVYVIGSRSFCTYACPYGALFGLLDRFAPGRLALVGDCKACGRCTAACTSHVRVHEEFAAHGMVVNPACLKDLDCVAACPNGAAGFAFRRPPGFASFVSKRAIRPKWDYSWPEELLLAGTFVVTIVVVRGLYGKIPFLMSLGIAVVMAWCAVHLVRLARGRDLRIVPFQLVRAGRVTRAGAMFGAVGVVLFGLLIHSGWMRAEEALGLRALSAAEARPDGTTGTLADAGAHLWRRARFGFHETPELVRARARTAELSGDVAAAEALLSAQYERDDGVVETAFPLARVIAARGRPDESARLLRAIVDLPLQSGRAATVSRRYCADAAVALAHLRAEARDFPEAERLLRRALEVQPRHALATYALSTILALQGNPREAIELLQRAAADGSHDADLHNNLGHLLLEAGDVARARAALERALELDPRHALAHFNLGRLLERTGERAASAEHFRLARELQPGLGPAPR